jgi:hypothetical protein
MLQNEVHQLVSLIIVLIIEGTSNWMGKNSQFPYQWDKLSLQHSKSQPLRMKYTLLLTLHVSVTGVNTLQYAKF